MKTALRCLAALLLLHGMKVPAEEAISAKELASRISSNLADGSSYIRLRMAIKGAGGSTTLQLQLKQRRSGSNSDILYQVLYPKERKGEAVLLQRQGGKITGKVFTPAGGVKDIASLKDSLLGSDLSYEDIAENFFSWSQQSFGGSEEVDKTPCQILESTSGGGSSYSRVRSWVDLRKLVPLRVEKYSGSGQLVRSVVASRVAKDDMDRWVVASLTVKRAGQDGETEIEGSNSRHDVSYTDKDFTAEGMQSLTPPASK